MPGRVKPRQLCQELCSGLCARHAWEDQPRSGVEDCHQSSSQSQLPCQSELPYQLPCHRDKMSAGRRKKWNQENLSEKCSKTILTYHIRIRLTEVIPCCNFSSQLSCLSCKNLIYLIKWLGILMWFIFWMVFLCKKKTTILCLVQKKQRRKNDPQSCNTGAATEKGNTVSTLLWNPRPVAVTKLQLPNFFDMQLVAPRSWITCTLNWGVYLHNRILR